MPSLQTHPVVLPPPSTTSGAPDRPWADAAAAVLALVLPVVCVGCGVPDRALCRACRSSLDALPGRTRLVAGVRLDAAHEYDGLVRTLVLEWKLRGRVDVVRGLTRRTADLVRTALAESPAGTVVLRVPPSPRGHRRRGFDPVVTVLRRAGVRRSRALRRVPLPGDDRADADGGRVGAGSGSDTPAGAGAGAVVGPGGAGPGGHGYAGGGQKERNAIERVAATVGTLVADDVADRDVVLVDDVVTTGVTMAEAIRAVRAAGGRVVRCVAVATVEV
ncbi:ComF family protein [Curtobacterium herbarum]|uniref:Phosphoribosyltransferase domain-containing protein n=1 Tax=Curtobacterium herbarum TaxID=150122 RepID=A0ABP4K717_9MICO|nr:phosphoribosyltransferase family protein [Curtobacterium herbarum]MBM7475034.1 putative amidophosphoribosyltransferase [Curtobacterium herbarum]MCS6545677.1 phosphoribosyltransferase family protein [Curtobacterium herbarum]